MGKKNKIQNNNTAENNRLQAYLTGKLNNLEQYEFEKNLEDDDPFVQDAIEGLKETKSDIDFSVYEINKQLKKKLQWKEKRIPRKISTFNIGFLSLVLILALIVIAYFVIRMYLKSGK